jgi:thiamine-phosphate pyrophosphorylase
LPTSRKADEIAVSDDDLTSSRERLITFQIIDVNLNRAAEGIRVFEEYCRFVLSDVQLTARCKALRDELHASLKPVSRAERLRARDTTSDVGTSVDFSVAIRTEFNNCLLKQVAVKNGERVKEALRAIEEFAKPHYPEVARQVGLLRYRWYDLERDCHLGDLQPQLDSDKRLCVLIDGGSSEDDFLKRAKALIDSGTSLVQLRDKTLDDRNLLARARLLRRTIDESHVPALFIVNDRPDIAVLARADGVHLGQEDMSVADARRIVGAQMLIGVSTHDIEQARQAVRNGASYIGCGPVFPSATKSFDNFPGLPFLRQVAAEINLPAFAIGGISAHNVRDILESGFKRVAVGTAIWRSDNSAAAARELLSLLQERSL